MKLSLYPEFAMFKLDTRFIHSLVSGVGIGLGFHS